MNLILLLAYCFINLRVVFADFDIHNEIAQSLVTVIENFFALQSLSFLIIISGEQKNSMNFFKDLLFDVFRHCTNIKTQIVINSEVQIRTEDMTNNIFLVDSLQSFLNIDVASKVKDNDQNEFYYIVLHNRDEFLAEEIQEIFEYCWSNYIINVNIQVQLSSGHIIVYTYYPFGEAHCRKVVPVEVNRFQNGTMLSDDIFPSKLLKMHSCPVRVAIWNSPPYLSLDPKKRGKQAIGGFEGKLLIELSNQMNFKIEIKEPPNNERRGLISANKTTGAVLMLKSRIVDLSLGNYWYSESRSKILTPSYFYYQVSNGAAFLAGPSYSSPIKALWIPFSEGASLALLIAFLFTMVAFCLIARQKVNRPSFIVRYQEISLGFIALTLGLPSFISKRNSLRIYLMSWMLFSFIIRTVYGAIIFHFMRNNLFRKAPETLDEVVKLNYMFVLGTTAYNALAQTSIFKDTKLTHILVNETQGEEHKYIQEHAHLRLITINPVETMLLYLAKDRRMDKMAFLKETFLIQNSCIFFTKHSFLVDRMNTLILRIRSVGLLNAWVSSEMDIPYIKASRPPIGMIIGQDDLKWVYFYWGVMLVFALLAFSIELLSVKVKLLRIFF